VAQVGADEYLTATAVWWEKQFVPMLTRKRHNAVRLITRNLAGKLAFSFGIPAIKGSTARRRISALEAPITNRKEHGLQSKIG